MDLIDESADPIAQFTQWYDAAKETEPNDANAMTVATVDDAGLPDARILLLKGRTEDGFIFYTNLTSDKAVQLLANGQAALLFHWKTQRRQIRMRGPVVQVEDQVADTYFAQRPRQSQLGAWASDQSAPLEGREVFEERLDAYAKTYPDTAPVPRPPHWSGFCLTPSVMEFWQDRQFRLHDRVRYTKTGAGWTGQRLYP